MSNRARRQLAVAAIGLAVAVVSVAYALKRRFTYIYEATTHFNRFDFRHEFEFGVTDSLQLSFYVADWRYQREWVARSSE